MRISEDRFNTAIQLAKRAVMELTSALLLNQIEYVAQAKQKLLTSGALLKRDVSSERD